MNEIEIYWQLPVSDAVLQFVSFAFLRFVETEKK